MIHRINRYQRIVKILTDLSGTIAKWFIAGLLLFWGATNTDMGNTPLYIAMAVLLIMTPHRRRGLLVVGASPQRSRKDPS